MWCWIVIAINICSRMFNVWCFLCYPCCRSSCRFLVGWSWYSCGCLIYRWCCWRRTCWTIHRWSSRWCNIRLRIVIFRWTCRRSSWRCYIWFRVVILRRSRRWWWWRCRSWSYIWFSIIIFRRTSWWRSWWCYRWFSIVILRRCWWRRRSISLSSRFWLASSQLSLHI